MKFKAGGQDGEVIRRMTDAMSHRGPDADGFITEEQVSMGHRRLSIIDLSTAANQPFEDNSGRYVMVFNGEMYNYLEVRQLLKDYAFRTSGDTEVLIAAYAKWGRDCLQYFRGMYAFAVWDRQEKELFIARDRLGVKPLYYYKDGDRLLWASEVRSILASGWVKRRLDRQALADFFTFQSVSAPHTPVEGVRQLEAGCWMKIRNGEVEHGRYWDVTTMHEESAHMDEQQVKTRIRELMLQSVQRRMISDVPVGAFLSGGIDSSAVVGLMAETGTGRPNTFNISFEDQRYDESPYAEMVAKKFNTHHTRLLMKPSVFLDEMQSALDSMDIPSADGINSYVVSKAIRNAGIVVALSGVGGDELFAGYPFFSQFMQMQKGKAWWSVPGFARKVMTPALTGGWNPQGRKGRMKQLLELPALTIDQAYPVLRQILSPGDLRELTTLADGGPLSTAIGEELKARKGQLQRLPLLSQVSAAEYIGYTQQTLLKDTDQMSMAVSLEVREPFFDQDLVEFVLSVPDRWKKPVYPKSLLVESLKPLLPDEIVFRKKQGFLFPWEVWLRKELRSFSEDLLQSMARRSFIKGDALLEYWRRFLAGDKRVRWTEIWLFVVLEYWLKKNEIEC